MIWAVWISAWQAEGEGLQEVLGAKVCRTSMTLGDLFSQEKIERVKVMATSHII